MTSYRLPKIANLDSGKPHIKLRNGWWICNNSVGTSPVSAYESWRKGRDMSIKSWHDFMLSKYESGMFAEVYRCYDRAWQEKGA